MIVSSTTNANEVENVGLNSFVYDITLNDTLFNDMHAKRQNFRNGFWRYTLERLLSLDAYFQDNDEEVIHVESDVVLLNGFEKYQIQTSKTSWLTHKDDEDSAAVLTIGNQKSFARFQEVLRSSFTKNLTLSEMQILRKMRRTAPKDYDVLPSIHANGDISLVQNVLGERIVFDPAALGMWMFGYDPRNHFGVTRKSLLEGAQRGDAFNLSMKTNSGNPHLYISGNTKVLSLHIHTKAEAVFIDPIAQIEKTLAKSNSKNSFSPRVFMEVYREHASRRKRLVFIVSALGLFKYLNRVKTRINDFFG
jgi:hypothetical protein